MKNKHLSKVAFIGVVSLLLSLSLVASTTLTSVALAITPTVTPTKLSPVSSAACKLPEAANRGDVGLGFPRYANRMASTGTVKAKVLFVDFSDVPATKTPQQVFSIISPDAPEFYKKVSYGRLNLQLDPVFKWLRMSKPSTDYSAMPTTYEGQRAYIQEAVDLAGSDVDYTNIEAVYVITNPAVTAIGYGPAFTGSQFAGISAGGRTISNGVTSGADLLGWGYLWLNHEVAHTMGLADLYAYSGSEIHQYVGDFGIMGNIAGKAPEYFAYERWLLGWLDDDQIVCQTAKDATTELTPIEKSGGIKAVMVMTSATSAVVIESRRALGYDAKIPKQGALVYTVNTATLSGSGPIQVVPNKDPQRYKSPLAVNGSITVGKVTIKVIKSTATGDTVRVTVKK